jgi:hypothetical protein
VDVDRQEEACHERVVGWNLAAMTEEDSVAEIADQEMAHGSFQRKLRKWRLRFEERRDGVAASR